MSDSKSKNITLLFGIMVLSVSSCVYFAPPKDKDIKVREMQYGAYDNMIHLKYEGYTLGIKEYPENIKIVDINLFKAFDRSTSRLEGSVRVKYDLETKQNEYKIRDIVTINRKTNQETGDTSIGIRILDSNSYDVKLR